MPTLAEVREQYPQYKDLSDDDLADKLHAKFYSDMPREEFDKKVGNKEKPKSKLSEPRKVLSKINEDAIADTVGAPVDLASEGLGALGLPTSKKPVGGSESIKGVFRSLGMSEEGAEPETITGKAIANVGGGAVSALLTGGGIGSAVKSAGEALGSAALKKGGEILASPGGNLAAGAGGGAGGAIAEEATKGSPMEGPATGIGEFLGGAVGGMAPASMLRPARAVDPVIAAYERLKLAPSAAEAGVGGRSAQWLEGNVLPQTIGGGGVMEAFKQKRLRQLTDIQQGIAQKYGTPKDRPEMGKATQESVMDTWNQIKNKDGQLIGALKQKYGQNVVYPSNFIDAVASPVGAAASKSIRESTLDPLVQDAAKIIRETGGHMTFDDLAALKTKYGYAAEPGFQKNVNDAQVDQLFSAVRKDMEQHIKTSSLDDYKALKESNSRYADAMGDFRKYFKKLVGSKDIPVSSERAYEILTAAATDKARGDIEEFKHVWDALPPSERGNLSATILSRMGAIDMSQPGSTETWSMGKFLTQYRSLSQEAKAILFKSSGNAKVAKELDDLATVIQNIQDRVRSVASTSKSGTGGVILGQFGLGAIAGHFAGGDVTGLLYGVGGPYMAAQVLTNPTAVKAVTEIMRRTHTAIDASARAVVDLGALPKLTMPTQQQEQQPPQ